MTAITTPAKVAHNSPRSFFKTTRKRCNSNDTNSMFEQAAGKLRAKLLWRGAEAGTGRTTSRHAERSSPRGRHAGEPPPTGTHSGQDQLEKPHGAQNTGGRHTHQPHDRPGTPHERARQRGGYRSTHPLSTHSATASSRLRPNGCQSWRRRRIHRNMPPTTAAPRPAPPIRPSKPVRARPFFGLVAGTSGAT